MKKILLIIALAVVEIVGYVPAEAMTGISGDHNFKDKCPNAVEWIEIRYKDGTTECIDNGSPCTDYYNENENGLFEYDHTFC